MSKHRQVEILERILDGAPYPTGSCAGGAGGEDYADFTRFLDGVPLSNGRTADSWATLSAEDAARFSKYLPKEQ